MDNGCPPAPPNGAMIAQCKLARPADAALASPRTLPMRRACGCCVAASSRKGSGAPGLPRRPGHQDDAFSDGRAAQSPVGLKENRLQMRWPVPMVPLSCAQGPHWTRNTAKLSSPGAFFASVYLVRPAAGHRADSCASQRPRPQARGAGLCTGACANTIDGVGARF